MQKNNRNFSILKENILKYLDFKGITKYECYQKTGITNGVLSQKNGMSEENLLKFLSYYKEVNPEWLLTGKGSMLKDGDNVSEPTPLYNAPPKGIPFVDAMAVAGFGSNTFAIHESDVKEYYVVPKFKDRTIDFMIEVSGASMYPKYASGDVIACTILRESRFIQWGKVYVLGTVEQGLLIKRIYQCPGKENDCLMCHSDNEKYPPFEIRHSEITGLALVVGVVRLE